MSRGAGAGAVPVDDGENVMKTFESPGTVAAPEASEIDELGRHAVSQTSRQHQFPQTPICARLVGSVRCEAERTIARDHTPCAKLASEQRRADVAAAQEFHQIKQFVAACRRQWPGAIIVLRPEARQLVLARRSTQNQHPEQKND
jgi:hypothetical protein